MAWLLPPLPPTFEAALRDVHARSPEARRAAAERLGAPERTSTEQALEGLLALADDADAAVRATAIRGLKELRDVRAMDSLLDHLDDPEALVRELSVVAIGALGGPRAQPALLRALRSAHPEVRFQAVASYAEGDAAEATAVAAVLRDPDPKVRANAARSLSHFAAEAHEALREALADPDPLVQSEAALVLARLGDTSCAPALRAAVGHPDLAAEALDAIGALGVRELCDAAATIAQSVLKPLDLKVAAARALLRLDDPRGVTALREVLRAFRSDGRSYAVQVVGELRVLELAGELERLTRRPRGVDPQTLTDALAALLPESEPARAGLNRLALRADAVGEQAKRALSRPL